METTVRTCRQPTRAVRAHRQALLRHALASASSAADMRVEATRILAAKLRDAEEHLTARAVAQCSSRLVAVALGRPRLPRRWMQSGTIKHFLRLRRRGPALHFASYVGDDLELRALLRSLRRPSVPRSGLQEIRVLTGLGAMRSLETLVELRLFLLDDRVSAASVNFGEIVVTRDAAAFWSAVERLVREARVPYAFFDANNIKQDQYSRLKAATRSNRHADLDAWAERGGRDEPLWHREDEARRIEAAKPGSPDVAWGKPNWRTLPQQRAMQRARAMRGARPYRKSQELGF